MTTPDPDLMEAFNRLDHPEPEEFQDTSELRARYLGPNGINVEIRKGDLTAESVDVIVNAANERLQHGGGVAGAISRKAGPVLQAICDDYVRVYGKVVTGTCMMTGAHGELPQDYIIHAVGPIMPNGLWELLTNGDPGDQQVQAGREVFRRKKGELFNAIQHALATAHLKGCQSISFCAISTGIFGFPVEECARLFISACYDFAIETEGNTRLRTIRLTNFDEPTVSVFESLWADEAEEQGFERV